MTICNPPLNEAPESTNNFRQRQPFVKFENEKVLFNFYQKKPAAAIAAGFLLKNRNQK